MIVAMLCYPPLGQATVVSAGQDYVKFIVHLESADGIALEKSSKNKPWEVALWHDMNREDGEAIWEEEYFSETSQAHHVVSSLISPPILEVEHYVNKTRKRLLNRILFTAAKIPIASSKYKQPQSPADFHPLPTRPSQEQNAGQLHHQISNRWRRFYMEVGER
jgi:hypothetical protein